jgi:endonuclease YncB( thermonuclease family)
MGIQTVYLSKDHVGAGGPDGGVHDGDTFSIHTYDANGKKVDLAPVRLFGADAPEYKYWNGSDPHGQPWSEEARTWTLQKLTYAKKIEIEYVKESGNRQVQKVWVTNPDGSRMDLGRAMVYDGMAYGDTYSGVNLDAMQDAKANKRGMWNPANMAKYGGGQPMDPADYRRDGAGQFEKHFGFHAINARTCTDISSSEYHIFAEGIPGEQLKVPVYKINSAVKVKITSDKYQPIERLLDSDDDDSKPIEIELVEKGSVTQPVVVKFTGPGNLVNGVQCSVDSAPAQQASSANGQATFHLVVGGKYNIFYQPQGAASGSKPIKTELNMGPVVIPLVKDGDGENVEGPDKNDSPQPVSPALLSTDDTPYDNNSYEGYFTSAQCRVYIGNLFLDELNTIQYALQSNAVPLYGYCDRDAAAYAQGRALVQGQLVLNYVADWYLYTALVNHDKLFNKSSDWDAADRIVQELKGASNAEVTAALSSLPQYTVRKVNYLMRQERAQGRSSSGVNACYYPGVFDIMIEIGDGDSKSTRRIEMCKIISNEQILDQSGQPVSDVYGFIGRRLR